MSKKKEAVNHPSHYQNDNPVYEVIKIIDAYDLDFCLGNAIKYILRAGKKKRGGAKAKDKKEFEKIQLKKTIEDLKKSVWYVNHQIEKLEKTST